MFEQIFFCHFQCLLNCHPDQLPPRLELLIGDEDGEEHGEEEVEDGDEDGGRVLDHQTLEVLIWEEILYL